MGKSDMKKIADDYLTVTSPKFPRPCLKGADHLNSPFSKTIQYILQDILKEMRYLPLAFLVGILLYLITIICLRRHKKPIRSTLFTSYFIMLFIPFGIFIPLKWKQLRNPFVCSFLGFCLSCIIEMIQLITERGHFQIDDIVTNTLGTLIGALIFRMYSFIMLKCRQFYA